MRSDPEPSGQRTFIEQARRAQIIAAATETVAEVGYARASLARIAERAGVSKGVISYHFDGKDELLAAVAGDYFERAWEHMEPRITAAGSASAGVAAWITSQLEYFSEHRSGFVAMTEVVMNHRTPSGARPFVTDEAEEVEGMAELLRAGQEAGELRDFDARHVARLLLHCANGVIAAWTVDPEVDLVGEAAALADLLLHAIKAGAPT